MQPTTPPRDDPRDDMPRTRQARLHKDPDTLTTRLPAELSVWLRAYAQQHEMSVNAVVVEALERFRAAQADK